MTDNFGSHELTELRSRLEIDVSITREDQFPTNVGAGPAPVSSADRFKSVDLLRGIALLGILAMNIVAFAWPTSVYSTPTLAPGYSWADLAIWMVQHLIFSTKMMTLFSMLFGAGLVLMTERSEARRSAFGRTYYRRIFYLLLIGLIHAYLIWDGDILVIYAMCGFALYPLPSKVSANPDRDRRLLVSGGSAGLVWTEIGDPLHESNGRSG